MAMARRMEVEWLDILPGDDPSAIRSRRDLKRVNAIMFSAGIMTRALAASSNERPRSILDLGSGDGTLMAAIARKLGPRWPDVRLTLLDRQPVVSRECRDAIVQAGWQAEIVAADVFDYLDRAGRFDIVTTNLFLHHFDEKGLRRLFASLAEATPLFVACEPWRALLPLAGSRLLWALGCNAVTRHDAVASVRAGFRDRELSALWPDGWQCAEYRAGLFTHCFVARHV
jgi:SAM-dependent methyltransferase